MAHFVVTTLTDEPFNGGESAGAPDGTGLSLREAVGLALANGAATADSISFAPVLAGGTLTLTNGALVVNSDVTISGDTNGNSVPDITIDAHHASGVFNVTAGTSTLDALAITGGNSNRGGGVVIASVANVTISNATVSGNNAGSGGGIYIYNYGTAMLTNTTVSDNSADSDGGGIFNAGFSTMTLVNTTVSDNSADFGGGGIANLGTATLTNTTVSGNNARVFGGGIASLGTATLTNTTVSGNSFSYISSHASGGIYSPGALTLTNSIVAGNSIDIFRSSGSHTYSGVNVFSQAGAGDAEDIIETDLADIFAAVGANPHTGVSSGVLADNGGPVATIAIRPGGVAHDTPGTATPVDSTDADRDANTTEDLSVDARGFARAVGANIDVGAFEQQLTAALVVTTLKDEGYSNGDLTAEMNDGDGLSLREALALANGDPTTADTISFDALLAGGTLTLTKGELVISSDLKIDGNTDGDNAPDITIDANHASRVFDVAAGSAALDSLVITGGAGDGGGVYVATGADAAIANSVVLGNSAGLRGGGIFNSGTASLTNTTVSDNAAGVAGGGIFNQNTVTLVNTTVSGNSAAELGGGIYTNGMVTLTNSTISGNSAAGGGGVDNIGTATLTNSIVAGNAAGIGPEIYGGSNTYSGVNVVGVGGDNADNDASDHVIETPTLGDLFAAVGANPDTGVNAGVLADNGGPVATIALKQGGVAHDAPGTATPVDTTDADGDGNTIENLPVDARGYARAVGASIDIGAFEQQAGTAFVVTTLDDELGSTDPHATLADFGGASDLSLREALVLAGQDPTAADTITFHPLLAGGTLTLTQGELVIASDLTIDGDTNGDDAADITIDANHASRVFNVAATATLDSLIITGGNSGEGGGVYVLPGADATIARSTITGNQAGDGGGILNSGTLTVINTTVSDNDASASGGGIWNDAGATLTLINATVAGNAAAVFGGGINNSSSGAVTLINSTVSGNLGHNGGGIANDGAATLTNSIVTGNAGPELYGAGTNTYSGVNVVGVGGASADNDASDHVIETPTLGDLFAAVGANPDTGVNAGLLADNGGPVQTIAIKAGGVAQDKGDAGFLPPDAQDLDGDNNTAEPIPVDARGASRVVGVGVDVGAFEVQNTAPQQTTNVGLSLNEGASAAITSAELDFMDLQQGAGSVTFTVTTDVTVGTLLLNGSAIGLTSTFTQDDIDHNRLRYSHDGSETTTTSFGFSVSDGVGGTVNGQTFAIGINAVNDAPVNTVPATQSLEANHSLAITGLSIADVDAGAGAISTTLSVAHGSLAVDAAGGASVIGSGTSAVSITGTLAAINATLAAANNVIYTPKHDDFDNDALTIVTNDGGNTGSGGPLADTDVVAINLHTHLFGTPSPDGFIALPGNERIDALTGVDTITFGFKLVEATVSFVGNTVIIDGPSSHTVLTGFEVYNFTDGTVNNNDADPLVDDLFYYSQYHDVWDAHVDADQHYHQYGWHERRDPDAFFSTSTYLSANPDVRAAGVDPLIHFDQFGWNEGRVPSIAFDPAAYLGANLDVKAAHIDPLAHFLSHGAQENRQPIAPTELLAANGFDYVYYLQRNPDVAAAHVDPFQHFETTGWKEGRNPNALFDTNGYLATYGDVKAANINPLDHYNVAGWHEGRDPSVAFDTTSYLAAYADIAAAHINPLTHFLAFGIHEGRLPFADGMWG